MYLPQRRIEDVPQVVIYLQNGRMYLEMQRRPGWEIGKRSKGNGLTAFIVSIGPGFLHPSPSADDSESAMTLQHK